MTILNMLLENLFVGHFSPETDEDDLRRWESTLSDVIVMLGVEHDVEWSLPEMLEGWDDDGELTFPSLEEQKRKVRLIFVPYYDWEVPEHTLKAVVGMVADLVEDMGWNLTYSEIMAEARVVRQFMLEGAQPC